MQILKITANRGTFKVVGLRSSVAGYIILISKLFLITQTVLIKFSEILYFVNDFTMLN